MAASSYPVLPDERLAAGVARLAVRHQGRRSVETGQRLIADSYERLAAYAHVRTHLVVPAERFATERLDALAHVENPTAGDGRPRVLLVYGHNAGRSQPAAALLAHRSGDGDGAIVSSAACPVLPGHRYLDWPVPEPDGAAIAVGREIRDALDARITALLDTLPSGS